MATPTLVNMPDSLCIANISFTLTRVVGVTESPFTLEEQAFKWPGERWSVSAYFPPVTNRKTAGEWQAFFAELSGRYNYFLFGDPMGKKPMGIATGTPLVDGLGQTGNTLVTDGWTPNTQGILLKGDYIQIGSGSSAKLHMITENANSNASGIASLSIQPALRTSPADGSPIIVNNPRGVFRLSDNSFTWSVRPGPVWSFSFDAVEVL